MNTEQDDRNKQDTVSPVTRRLRAPRRKPFDAKNLTITDRGACEYHDGQQALYSGTREFLALMRRANQRLRTSHDEYKACRYCSTYRKTAIAGVPVCVNCISRRHELDSTDLLHIAAGALQEATTASEGVRTDRSAVTIVEDTVARVVVPALYYLEKRRQSGALSVDLFWLNEVETPEPAAASATDGREAAHQ